MKQQNVPYGKISLLLLIVITLAAASGILYVRQQYSYLLVSVPLIGLCIVRFFTLYGEIVRRLMFIFHAVQNDDYSFRFTENPEMTRHAMVNYSLNRIKEVLDHTKLQIREKEKYFELIMECANIGILTIRDNGTVVQSNSQALHIVRLPHIQHIDQLRPLSGELCQALHAIRPSEQCIVRFATELGDLSLMLSCSELVLNGNNLRVISIGNINEELDRMEVESWEKLTRILTHEIMNSLAPVTSISHTLLAADTDPHTLQEGLETIHATSERLMRFVDSFRAVTRIPTPQKAPFYLSELINEVLVLTIGRKIRTEVSIDPEDTMLYADRTLISQVMVNLLKNASDALEGMAGEGCITIRTTIGAEERIRIEVTDNGPAIPHEVAENIFTPFYTTKPDGSGIGLAVSRQIVRLHGGSLRLKHNEEGCVTFAILLD